METMKTKFTYFFLAFMCVLALPVFQSCDGKDDDDCVGCPVGEDKTDLTITVIGASGNNINNNKVLCVVGQDREAMNWLDYKLAKINGENETRVTLTDVDKIKEFNLDTFYMRVNGGGDKVGGIKVNGEETGTRTIHVVDGGLNTYEGLVSIVKDSDGQLEVQTKPLGRLRVTVSQSSVEGNELNGATVGIFGNSLDTVEKALVKKFEDVPKSHQARLHKVTSTQKVAGIDKDGVAYFFWVPAREYFAVAYLAPWSDQKIPGKDFNVSKNQLRDISLHFAPE